MRPAPTKLALLMSVAGLGLSLGEPALAKTGATGQPHLGAALGMPNLWHNRYAPVVELDASLPTGAPGPLDAALGPVDESAVTSARRAFKGVRGSLYMAWVDRPDTPLSEADRAAIALAMVLMPEPPFAVLTAPTLTTGEVGAATSFAPALAPEAAAPNPVRAPGHRAAADSAARGRATAPGSSAMIDLDLDLDLVAAPAAASGGAERADAAAASIPALGATEAEGSSTVSARPTAAPSEPGALADVRASVEAMTSPQAGVGFDLDLDLSAASRPVVQVSITSGSAISDSAGSSPVSGAVKPAKPPAPAAGSGHLDLNLDLSGGVDVDLDLGSAWGSDAEAHIPPSQPLPALGGAQAFAPLDLDLGADAGLDLSAGLDLYASAGHRSSVPAVEANEAAVASAVPVPLATAVAAPVTSATSSFSPASTSSSQLPVAMPVATLTAPAAAATELAASVQRAGKPVELSCSADPVAMPTELSTRIVVASHSDRVLRSLEALLAGDDPATGRFGAKPAEIFVSSHAEKAMLMLAGTQPKGGRQHSPAAAVGGGDIASAVAAPSPALPEGVAAPAAAATEHGAPSAPSRAVRRSALGGDLVAIGEGTLDGVRGGFQTDSGLQISFGIERAVYVNGSLVTTTNLNVSDLGKVAGGQAAVTVGSLANGSGNLALIQTGPGNSVTTGPVSAASLGTIVQNTLNDQKIQSVTAINATVNSLQVMKSQNLVSSLRSAVIDSLRR